jgi:hypothetical protein
MNKCLHLYALCAPSSASQIQELPAANNSVVETHVFADVKPLKRYDAEVYHDLETQYCTFIMLDPFR